MRKDEPEIIPFLFAKREVPYDARREDNPDGVLIPLHPPVPSPPGRSLRAHDPVKTIGEDGLMHVNTLREGLERFLPRQEEHSHREDVSLEGTVALFSPRFKAYFTRPDGGGIYVSHDELKTPAGVCKGQGWYLPTLPPHPRFSRFRPLHDGGVGVIIFTPARAYDPMLIATLRQPSFPSPALKGYARSSSHAGGLTADVSLLESDHVIVVGEAYHAFIHLPAERDA